MTDSNLLIEIENGVAKLILNRPDVHNAFDDLLIAKIITALTQIETNDDIRVVVLTSQGKHFSAGADLNWMKRMAILSEQENRDDAQQLAELMHQLNNLNKPTIALVNGAAYGGAVGLIACCDIAIATQRSRFCLSEVKIGLSPAVISPFVVGAIGERAARRYFLSAEAFDAQKAEQLGLLHDVVADEVALAEQGEQLINVLLQNSPQAMNKTKQLIKEVSRGSIDKNMRDYTVNLIASIRVSDEGQEGLSSFLEKRQPKWLQR
ncbi:MAG: methylglutaconyl-CoA hydratase [Oceanicoccus sp.]|jgi:methylglutaconyl-CoA hydratase